MKLNKAFILGALLMMMAALAACAGASAPPIDLPAPITGRIDVSNPDDEGNVTITGSEGAVTGGALVLVVNESESGSANLRLFDLIVPSAYAEDYPAVCSEVGHACVYAEEDGSFVLIIAATSEDVLSIGLIYSYDGEWRSETIQFTVPNPAEPEANCAGKGLSGKVVDMKIAPVSGIPMLLKQGSDTTTNQLVIGADGETTVDISGCYAHTLAIKARSGSDRVVVTSKDDKIIWVGEYASDAFSNQREFTTKYEPMHATFIAPYVAPIVAFKTSDSVEVALVSLIDGTLIQTMELLGSSGPITGLTRSIALRTIKMENSLNQYLGLLVTDKGDNLSAYVTIFRADTTLANKITVARTNLTTVIGNVNSIADAALSVYNGEEIIIDILDSVAAKNSISQCDITVFTSTKLSWGIDLDSVTEWNSIGLKETTSYPSLAKLTRITTMLSASPQRALAVTTDGKLVNQTLYGSPSSSTSDWTVDHSIAAIDIDETLHLFYGADATDNVVIDGTSLVY